MSSALRALALAVLAAAALNGAARRPVTIFDLNDAIGRHVPTLTLQGADGVSIPLDALRGKPTYVFLFAGWCGPCQEEMPFVRRAYAAYGDRVQFIGVDVLEDPTAARAAIAAAALPFPVAIYPIEQLDAVIAPVAQLQAGWKYRIPADFLVDGNGIVRYAWHGLAVDDHDDPVDVLPSYLAKLGIR
jgi:peroxiredoxin